MAKRKIGTIVNTYGLKGQIKISITTTNPEKRFQEGKKIFIQDESGKEAEYTITSVIRKNNKIYYVGLEGFQDINQIEWMVGKDVYANVRLEKGSYYYDDLIGSKVVSPEGKEIGTVDNFTVMPAGEYLIMQNHYIPFQIGRFIQGVDKKNKTITLLPLAMETLK